MASTIPTTASASAASVSRSTPQYSSYAPFFRRHCYHSSPSKISFRFSPKSALPYSAKGLQCSWNRHTLVRAQLNELKQLDCELLIRKKDALMHSPPPAEATSAFQAAPPTALTATSAPPPSSASSATPSLPAAKPAKSSLPPLKSPMAGTFYRSPAPGEPPFVKVGDKVQKGQVLCIIEAMKLMNEIEADQSGTLVEIIAEDGKPVSVDTALFVIEL